jgi:hypothetical protein
MKHEKLVKAFMDFLDKNFGDVATEEVHQDVEVRKSVDEMERRALFVVLEPQNDDGTTDDLHGDWYNEKDIAEACRSFKHCCNKANLYHSIMIDESVADIEFSYITPANFDIETPEGDIVNIKKGTWLQEWHFPENPNDDTWSKVLSGHFTGLSVSCGAVGYNLEEQE